MGAPRTKGKMAPAVHFARGALGRRLGRMRRLLPAVLMVTLAASAQDAAPRRSKKGWIASIAALAAVNVLDIYSSRGRLEANPLLRGASGRFDTRRALMVKGGATGGFVLFQVALVRRRPGRNYYPLLTLANTVSAGALGAVAVRNYASVPRPDRSLR